MRKCFGEILSENSIFSKNKLQIMAPLKRTADKNFLLDFSSRDASGINYLL
jgi:hypothetical protein